MHRLSWHAWVQGCGGVPDRAIQDDARQVHIPGAVLEVPRQEMVRPHISILLVNKALPLRCPAEFRTAALCSSLSHLLPTISAIGTDTLGGRQQLMILLCCREAVLEDITHPSEENTQRKEAVTTPVQKVDNPDLVSAA